MRVCTGYSSLSGEGGGQEQVRPVHAKVLAIDTFPPPSTKKELRRFLGMVGYYRGFCFNFLSVVAPLTDLLKESSPGFLPVNKLLIR